LRVIAGRWRGRRLAADRGRVRRPTADRVKEALFSILGDAVSGSLCVDLCCGGGGLGIEALSRGARAAIFVDRDPRALDLTRTNLVTCGAESERYRLVRAEARRWLAAGTADLATGPALIVADPPYGEGIATDLATVLAEMVAVTSLVGVALEHGVEETIPPVEGLRGDRRQYGGTSLTLLWPTAMPEPRQVEEGR